MISDGGGWFDAARLGLFVHWNHASLHGRELSWPLVGGLSALPYSTPVPVEEYYRDAMTFAPQPAAPRQWMALARRAGMRYAVLTAKHHDGFALWPTTTNDFHIGNTPYGGDLVGEFADAARAEGLRVGIYFSLPDWHDPDYPAFRDDMLPYQFIGYPRPDPDTWKRFTDRMLLQLRELLSNYGDIAVLWFDGGWERGPDEWRAKEIEALIRELQPDLLVNDRLPTVGDYVTPEQFVPAAPPDGRWEVCMTMNKTWGWCPDDTEYKSARQLVHTLSEIAGRGGNLLLNVSPTETGALPPRQVERLEALAAWVDRHGEAIFETTPGLQPWQWYGPSTRRGSTFYLHALMRPYETIVARGLPIRRVKVVRDLASGTELSFSTRAAVLDELLSADPIGEVEIEVPSDIIDDLATVLELTIEGEL